MEILELTDEELEGADIRKIWYTNSYGERVFEEVWFDNFDCLDCEMAEILKQDEEFRRWKSDKEKFLVSEEDKNKSGVYKIQLNNKVYIGQTKDFNARFNSHSNTKVNKTETATMLRNGATFEILNIENSLEERLILETFYINKYIDDGYIVINKIIDTTTKPMIKYKNRRPKASIINTITFNSSDLDKITKLLSDNNIEFKLQPKKKVKESNNANVQQ